MLLSLVTALSMGAVGAVRRSSFPIFFLPGDKESKHCEKSLVTFLLKKEDRTIKSTSDSDLIGSFGNTRESEETKRKPNIRNKFTFLPTCSEISTSILGSLESLPAITSWANDTLAGSVLTSWTMSITSDFSTATDSEAVHIFEKVKDEDHKAFRRASSCDTSNGIEDIEDFEMDENSVSTQS